MFFNEYPGVESYSYPMPLIIYLYNYIELFLSLSCSFISFERSYFALTVNISNSFRWIMNKFKYGGTQYGYLKSKDWKDFMLTDTSP